MRMNITLWGVINYYYYLVFGIGHRDLAQSMLHVSVCHALPPSNTPAISGLCFVVVCLFVCFLRQGFTLSLGWT